VTGKPGVRSDRSPRPAETPEGGGSPFLSASFDNVAVAASAGGLRALDRLLSGLPGDFPAAVPVVQHLDPCHRSVMHEILGRHTPLRVVQPEESQQLEGGTVYIAPPDCHLLVNGDATLFLSHSELVHFVRPSADLLFDSSAASYRDRVIAVVLTGTGSDGSLGVQAVRNMRGTVIVQDPEDAEFSGMPAATLPPQVPVPARGRGRSGGP
jgi:two-component system chemotaxis response regulator CheB